MDRARLEDFEAAMWKDMLSNPSEQAREGHANIFKALQKIEQYESAQCGFCSKIASNKCSKCNNEFYCDELCQKNDWDLHKVMCQTPLELADSIEMPSPSEMKPYTVVVLLRKTVLTVCMSRDEMIDFNLFVQAIQAVYPSFDKVKDFGWQHWQTVREYWST
jgi:hypothetical protein